MESALFCTHTYDVVLPHFPPPQIFGAAPCPKYDTRRGVMVSLHAGVLRYLRILDFFCHNLSIVETLCDGCKSVGEDVVASLGM